MSEVRWVVEFRRNGGTRYSRSGGGGFKDEALAMEVARRAATDSPEIGVRVVREERSVVWRAGTDPNP